jgi:hypothetical protein
MFAPLRRKAKKLPAHRAGATAVPQVIDGWSAGD